MSSKKSSEEFTYGHVLEALTGGLYPNKLDVLREYVQNSYDSIRDYLKTAKPTTSCTIHVTIKAGSLIVSDDGTGMDLEAIREYRKIGYSKKPFGEYAGWRGIGKAAGLAVADKLIVTTSPTGTAEGYQLEFNSAEMLKVVRELRAKNQNIPLNQLIEEHSRLETFKEEKSDHYTTVELCKVNPESSELLDANRIEAHLSQVGPVPFHPEFEFGKKIAENLSGHADEYLPVRILVNGQQIFKAYRKRWEAGGKSISVKEPEFLPVYDEKGELIAYSWYCMNSGKGQISVPCTIAGQSVNTSGLVYRVRDIRIGDAQLTRETLWRKTPERAFYAMGEVHVLDPRVEPTADRNDFKDNFARYQMYQNCSKMISTEISRKAGQQSLELNAKERIEDAHSTVQRLDSELDKEEVPKELLSQRIYQAYQAKEEVHKRRPFAKTRALKRKADQTAATAEAVIERLTGLTTPASDSKKQPKGVYDIAKDLGFSRELTTAYDTIVRVLRDYFLNDPNIYEELITRIQQELRRALMSQE